MTRFGMVFAITLGSAWLLMPSCTPPREDNGNENGDTSNANAAANTNTIGGGPDNSNAGSSEDAIIRVIDGRSAPLVFSSQSSERARVDVTARRAADGTPEALISSRYLAADGWSADLTFDLNRSGFRFQASPDRELAVSVSAAGELELVLRDANGTVLAQRTVFSSVASAFSRRAAAQATLRAAHSGRSQTSSGTIRVHAMCESAPVEWLEGRLRVIFERTDGLPNGVLYPDHHQGGDYVLNGWGSGQDYEPQECEGLLSDSARARLCENDDLNLFLQLLSQRWFLNLVTAVLHESAEALELVFIQIINDNFEEITNGEFQIPEEGLPGPFDDLDRQNLALMVNMLTDILGVFCTVTDPCSYLEVIRPAPEQDTLKIYAEMFSAPCGGVAEPVRSPPVTIQHPWPSSGIDLYLDACDNADRHRLLLTLEPAEGDVVVRQHVPTSATGTGLLFPPDYGIERLGDINLQPWESRVDCGFPVGNPIDQTVTTTTGGAAFVLLNQTPAVIEGAFVVGGRVERHTDRRRNPTPEEASLNVDWEALRAYCEERTVNQETSVTIIDFVSIARGENATLQLLLEPANLSAGACWRATVSATSILELRAPVTQEVCVGGGGDIPGGCSGPASVPIELRIPFETPAVNNPMLPPVFFDALCSPIQFVIEVSVHQTLRMVGDSQTNGRIYFKLGVER